MEVSKQLKKQIIIEIIALLFLVAVIIYAIFAINTGNSDNILSQDGMVLVLDNTSFKGLKASSDGEGLETNGIIYTVTNNNDHNKKYKLIITPSIHNEEILNQIRISVDDMFIEDITDLERIGGGYVVSTYDLKPGYTKRHLIKSWFKLDTSEKILLNKINFDFEIVIVE